MRTTRLGGEQAAASSKMPSTVLRSGCPRPLKIFDFTSIQYAEGMFCIVSSVVRTSPLVRLIEPAKSSLYDGLTYHGCPSKGLLPGSGDGGEGEFDGDGEGVEDGSGAGEGEGEGAGAGALDCHLPLQAPSQLACEASHHALPWHPVAASQ